MLDRFTRPAEPVFGGIEKQPETEAEQRAPLCSLPAPDRRRSGIAAENDMSLT